MGLLPGYLYCMQSEVSVELLKGTGIVLHAKVRVVSVFMYSVRSAGIV